MSFYTDVQYKISSVREDDLTRKIYLEFLGEDRPGPQLDIGCSIGNFVALDPGRIEGADIDRDALEVCLRRGLPCRLLDVMAPGALPPEHYEVIYLRHVVEHLENPLPAMRAVHAALRQGGLCVVETPDYLRAHHRTHKNFWDDYTHKRPFTRKALERLGHDAGFAVRRWIDKPRLGRVPRLLLRRGLASYGALAKWQARLGLASGDLAFVFEKRD